MCCHVVRCTYLRLRFRCRDHGKSCKLRDQLKAVHSVVMMFCEPSSAPVTPMALVFVLLTLDFSAVMIPCNNNRFQSISGCSAACVQMLVAVTIINSGCYVR